MFDIGWTELLVIGIVALIVVGPKDLPVMFRNLGRMVGKARALATDFQKAMNSAADEAGVNELAKDLRETASGKNLGLDEFREIAKGPKGWVRDAAVRKAKSAATGSSSAKGEAAADKADAELTGTPARSRVTSKTPPAEDDKPKRSAPRPAAKTATASKATPASKASKKPTAADKAAARRADGWSSASDTRKPAPIAKNEPPKDVWAPASPAKAPANTSAQANGANGSGGSWTSATPSGAGAASGPAPSDTRET